MNVKTLLIISAIFLLVACSGQASGEEGGGDKSDTKMHHGQGAPSSSLGNDFDHYYDESSRYVWEKNSGEWLNKYAIGGNCLINEKVQKRASPSIDVEKDVLTNALINSFYSTNITCEINVLIDSGVSVSGFVTSIDAEKYSIVYDGFIYYMALHNDGDFTIYNLSEEPGGALPPGIYSYNLSEIWHDDVFVPNTYGMFPFPSFDTYSYRTLSIYQEDLGQQTSIVISRIDEFLYDTENDLYTLQNITVTHDEVDSNFCYWYYAGSVTFDFSFRLSSDNSHAEYASIKTVSSTYGDYYSNYEITYSFSNYHTTSVAIPE